MGARTLYDVLQSFPGLFLSIDDIGFPILGIYGLLGQNRVQLFLDGIRQNDPYDGAAFLSLPAQVIDYIDVYYGPGGTWYGDGSLVGIIVVNTKSLSEIRYFSYLGSDASIGGGLLTTVRTSRLKAGTFGSFSAFRFIDEPTSFISKTSSFVDSNSERLNLKDLWAFAFIDAKISNTAQAHAVARSSLVKESYGPTRSFSEPQRLFGQNKTAWITDLHLLKKKAQKNALDIFLSTGVFRGHNYSHHDFSSESAKNLDDHYNALRLEIGTKFHFKPLRGHDLFVGVGGVIQGANQAMHIISTSNDPEHGKPTEQTPMKFGDHPLLFGRPSSWFDVINGHVYGFIQDEWQIKAPLLVALGSRLFLPIESGRFSSALLPNIGMVLTPISRFRLKLAYQTSLRTASFFEKSDRLYEAISMGLRDALTPAELAPEKSRSLESSILYVDYFGDTQYRTGVSGHISKIDDAISFERAEPLTNRNELHVFGLRSTSEVIFTGGHHVSLGFFYSLGHRKVFDENGYPTCSAGIFNLFKNAPSCPVDYAIPRVMIRASIFFDLLSLGSLNLANSFIGAHEIADISRTPFSLFDATYQTKPLFRYMICFANIKTGFGGFRYKTNSPDLFRSRQSFHGGFLVTAGLNISI